MLMGTALSKMSEKGLKVYQAQVSAFKGKSKLFNACTHL
jgi:hypothetical protein